MEPIASTVGRNLADLRRDRHFSTRALARRTAELGCSIAHGSITKLEHADRAGVSVDDLFVLAVALQCSPLRLLLPHDPGPVQVVPNVSAEWREACAWASGEQPLTLGERMKLTDPRVRAFIRENRPWEDEGRPATEVARWLAARVPGPFTATVRADAGGQVTGQITLGQPDNGGTGGAAA